MTSPQRRRPNRYQAAEIVRDAGGELIGRIRLQKIAYLLELSGLGCGFRFAYHFYGPYSEELARSMDEARAFDLVDEEERKASWGGVYSIFRNGKEGKAPPDPRRHAFIDAARQISSIELELAATAAYLRAVENHPNPWAETQRRKLDKAADGRLERAKEIYRTLREIPVPRPLPALP